MKLSLPRVTLLLQFLATLLADDDDGTLPPAIVNASSNKKTTNLPLDVGNDRLHQHSIDNSENDVDVDASTIILTQAQHLQLSNSIPDNGTDERIIKTAAEVLHDDSLAAMPPMIPAELMNLGRIQSDHIEVVVPADGADALNKSIGTTRTDASREQIENSSVDLEGLDEHEGRINSGDKINELLEGDIEHSIEGIIPEIPEIGADKILNIDQTENESGIDLETVSRRLKEESVIPNQEEGEEEEDEEDDEDDGPSNEVVVDYANKSTGAIILDKSPNFKGTGNLLLSNNDRYAISPCEEEGVKYVIIGLSEDIQVNTIKLSSYERYSSTTRKFEVLGSTTYPISSKWEKLGTFEAKPWFKENGEQTFELEHPSWCRYLKFRFITHYGVEHYCTVTQFKVHGSTTQQGFHMEWDAEENNQEEDEVVAGKDQADATLDGVEMSDEGQTIESNTGMTSTESASSKEEVIDDTNHEIEVYDGDEISLNDGVNTEQSDKVAAREGLGSTSDDSANETTRRENPEKNEALVLTTEPHSIPHSTTDDTSSLEKKVVNISIKNQTIKEEILEKFKSGVIDDVAPQLANIVSNTESAELNTSSTAISHELESKKKNISDRPKLNSIHSHAQGHALNIDSFLAAMHPESSALFSASIKTASSKFVTEEAKLDVQMYASSTSNAVTLDSQVTSDQNSPTMYPVKNIRNSIKTKIAAGTEIVNERIYMSNPLPQGGRIYMSNPLPQGVSSTVSKVMKDAIDTMKGAPYLSGLQDIINSYGLQDIISSKLNLEAFQDSKTVKSNLDESDSETILDDKVPKEEMVEVNPVDTKKNPTERHISLPSSSSSSIDTSTGTKSESIMSRDDILISISDRTCLDDLDFQAFKAKLSKSSGPGSMSGNGATGASKNEPIFKKLTDEIKVLQTSQGIHDQYVKAMTTCYEKIIIDFYKEISFLKVEQEERLLSLEEQIRLLGQKQEDTHQNDNTMAYIEFSYTVMCKYLNIANQWFCTLLSTMVRTYYILETHMYENETVQEVLQLIKFHIGEICAFFAGSIFCFLVVSFVWWFNNRKVAVDNSKYTKKIENVKEPQEKVNVTKGDNGKRKKKARRKQKARLQLESLCTDYSESEQCSIHTISTFD